MLTFLMPNLTIWEDIRPNKSLQCCIDFVQVLSCMKVETHHQTFEEIIIIKRHMIAQDKKTTCLQLSDISYIQCLKDAIFYGSVLFVTQQKPPVIQVDLTHPGAPPGTSAALRLHNDRQLLSGVDTSAT